MGDVNEIAVGTLEHEMVEFLLKHPAAKLPSGEPMFDAPVLGVADGDDPIFIEYKRIIGPFHMTPREVFAYAEGADEASPERLSVICWALPIGEAARSSNRNESVHPSLEWAWVRTHGESLNEDLRRHVAAWLRKRGYLAVAPAFTAGYKVYYEDVPSVPASTWSERHALYAAGLGTFSLSDGFITSKGIAMRCGSVVTNLVLPPTARRYRNHTANCLYLSEGSCGVCIDRCPAGAISEKGHDKLKCRAYVYGDLLPWRDVYGVHTVGCGLCQTAVPCEDCIPG